MALRILVATKNLDKRREVRRILESTGVEVELVEDAEWPDVEETGDTLVANALLKARAAAAATGEIAVADDTGLEVDALDGAPGVRTSRYWGPPATYEHNRRSLLSAMEGIEDRSARFRTVVAMVEPGADDAIIAEGVLEGRITTEERGDGGFGYDPIFEVDGLTLAEMGDDHKNEISHRALAFRALAHQLADG